MKNVIYKLAIIVCIYSVVNCKGETADSDNSKVNKSITQKSKEEPILWEVTRTFTEKNIYSSGDQVRLDAFKVRNVSKEDVKIDSMWIEVGTAHTNATPVTARLPIGISQTLASGGEITIPKNNISIETKNWKNQSYLVHLKTALSSTSTEKPTNYQSSDYLTFFRIAGDRSKLSYSIEKESYTGMEVYRLRGGLSAEYAVQKSAANLNRGISHSWIDINPPRESSADFLQRSINQTINFYNKELGNKSVIKRVIISTGITPISYISRTMDAPILPLHYLVGASTTKEVQTMLDYANANKLSAYATYGHDYSLSTQQGVAWLKLLKLPAEYKKFIIDHQVEEVVFFGATSLGGGEKAAKQYQNKVGHRGAGSIYFMYFAGEKAEGYLSQVIKDFSTDRLGATITIADWESGIIQKQVDNMTIDIKSSANVQKIALVTAKNDDIALWNMASYAMMKFYKMNHIKPTGISLNPYLAGHPFYESYYGIIPFTYFNFSGFPLSAHTNRIEGMFTKALRFYFPKMSITHLEVYANTGTRTDFFQWFKKQGYSSITNLPNNDVWNRADNIKSPSEVRATQLTLDASAQELKVWGDKLTYLSIKDLKDIATTFTNISVIEQ